MDYSTRQYLIALKGIAEEEGSEKCARELKESFEAALKAAESGEAEALHTLGAHYDYGFGTEEDEAEAFKYYEKAAYLGHAHSMHLVAWDYANGCGVEANKELYYEWERKAAFAFHEAGDNDAAFNCLHGLPRDEESDELINEMLNENDDRSSIDRANAFAGYGWADFKDGYHDEALTKFYQAIGCNDEQSIFYQCRSEIFRASGYYDDADWDMFRAKLIDMRDEAEGKFEPASTEFLATFGLEALKPLMYTEDHFDILQNELGELLLYIKTYEGRIRLPELFYSGGENAVLRRRFDQFVLLDKIHPDIREALDKADKIIIAEFSPVKETDSPELDGYEKKAGIINEYVVSVRHLDIKENLDTAEDVRKNGYVFFSALSARVRDSEEKIKQLLNWEDHPTLAAILAREEDYEQLGRYIEEKLPLNDRVHKLFRDWEPTPIYYVNAFRVWANMKEPAKMVAYLATFGADPNITSGKDDTPLGNQCMKKGTPEGVKALLFAGADPNKSTFIDDIEFKPLFLVLGPSDYNEEDHTFIPTETSQVERAKLLIYAGADVNGGDVDEGYYQGLTPLSWVIAFCTGDERNELIKIMLEKGANVPTAILGLIRGCIEHGYYEYAFTLYEIYREDSPIKGLVHEPQLKMAAYFFDIALKAGYKPALALQNLPLKPARVDEYVDALTEEERKDASEQLYTLLEGIQKPASFLEFVPVEENEVPINQAQLSHSGGLPYFEEGDRWPHTDNGEPLDFVFQVFQDKEGSVALPEGVLLLQYFSAGKGAGLYITYEMLAEDQQITIEPPDGAYVRPYCAIEMTAGLMLPDPEDLYRFSRKALTLVNKIVYHRLAEYEALAHKDGAAPLANDYPEFSCYLGGYPRWDSSGRFEWPLDTFLCQLDMDEYAQIDFGDATVMVFYDLKRGYAEEVINEW